MAAGIAQDFTSIECSICKEILQDPRALPCGHSYCGPPKRCLQGVQKPTGVKCAYCKKEFNLQISQLNPLYGIRDFLHQSTEKAKTSRKNRTGQNDGCLQVMCKFHQSNPVMFWCKKCRVKACTECFDEKHQSHDLISFTKYLAQKVSPIYEKLSKRVQLVQRKGEILTEKLEEIKADDYQKQLANNCCEDLVILTKEWTDVSEFQTNIKARVNLNAVESFDIQSDLDEIEKIEERLKFIKVTNLADFRISTQLTFFLPSKDSKSEIGCVIVPYKDLIKFHFEISILQKPAPVVFVHVNVLNQFFDEPIESILGKIEVNIPLLDYTSYIITEIDKFGCKKEHRFSLPKFHITGQPEETNHLFGISGHCGLLEETRMSIARRTHRLVDKEKPLLLSLQCDMVIKF